MKKLLRTKTAFLCIPVWEFLIPAAQNQKLHTSVFAGLTRCLSTYQFQVPRSSNTVHIGTANVSGSVHSKVLSSIRTVSTQEKKEQFDYLDVRDEDIFKVLSKDMTVIKDFLTREEEECMLEEVDRYMKRLRYEYDHWDNAIHGYRETEKKTWNGNNTKIIDRVKKLAFSSNATPLAYIHVLDLAKEGYIKPHVDAVRFCGDTITGMCLLSSCVMRLALEKDSSKYGDVYLPRRSLYIMKGRARYEFTHEVLKEEESLFKSKVVPRERRISVICRNEPNPEDRA